MRLEDKKDFAAMLLGVAELYGKGGVGDAALEIYFNALAAYELAEVRKSFSAYVQGASGNAHFMPKPADIIALLSGGEMAAVVAWAKVRDAVGGIGRYQSVCFDDARIHAAIALMGGWLALCGKADDEKELKWVEMNFVKIYNGLKSVGEYPSHLPGLSELQNSRSGFRVAPPVPVGDVVKAREVYRLGLKRQAFPRGGGFKRLEVAV